MNSSKKTPRLLEPIWYIGKCGLFESLPQKEMETLASRGRLMPVKKGEEIYNEADAGKHVYLIKEGSVKIVTTTSDGKEIILAHLGDCELFGETALVDDSPRRQRAVAKEECCLIVFDVPFFEKYMMEYPALNMSITKLIGLRLRRIQTRLQNLMFRTPKQRLAALMLELAEDYGAKDDPTGDIEIKMRITHSEMASLIGVTRESVTYAMGALEYEEMIRTVKRKIYITSSEKLGELAR